MKKLNNREISTLANKIASQINEPIEEYNRELNKEAEKMFEKSKEYKIIQKVLELDEDLITSWALSSYKDDWVSKNFNLSKKQTTRISIVEDEIILAQIDCESLDDLTAKVKASLSE